MKRRDQKNEIEALDRALDEFVNECRARLHEMARRGWRGWDDEKHANNIAKELEVYAIAANLWLDRLHLTDIANRAMMLWWQEWRQ